MRGNYSRGETMWGNTVYEIFNLLWIQNRIVATATIWGNTGTKMECTLECNFKNSLSPLWTTFLVGSWEKLKRLELLQIAIGPFHYSQICQILSKNYLAKVKFFWVSIYFLLRPLVWALLISCFEDVHVRELEDERKWINTQSHRSPLWIHPWHVQFTRFLPRTARKESNVPKLNSC